MPVMPTLQRRRWRRTCAPFGATVALLLLAGCFGSGQQGGVASMSGARADRPAAAEAGQGQSPRIAGLQARRSILPPGGPFWQVTDAILRTDSGAGAAELRMARLRAAAKDKNWLPKIGPAISLSALNGLAAGLLVQQAMFDHGRRKAERAYAAADVEVAAVALAAEINQRAFEGLTAYITAERARAQGAVSSRGLARLQQFQQVMTTRVEGGISDGSEAQIIAQKVAELASTAAADRQAEAVAMADLAALTGGQVAGLRGIDTLPVAVATARPLSALQTEAEGERSVAEAEVARADLLPGLTAGVDIDGGGISPAIDLGAAGLMGAGTKAQVQALDATRDAMTRRTAEADEAARRRITALQGQIALLRDREAQGAAVLAQTEKNLDLAGEQYKAGRKSLVDLAQQHESFAMLQHEQVAISYQVALIEIEIARDRGLLVDGARM